MSAQPDPLKPIHLIRHLALAQIDVEAGNVPANLDKLRGIVLEHREADLVVFPELVLQGHLFASDPAAAHDLVGSAGTTGRKTADAMHAFALENDLRVLYGELDEVGGELYNFATYVGGGKVERYAKTHVHWSESFAPGRELRAFESSVDRIGVLICFDAAFPEAARVLAVQGATTIVCIAAVPRRFPAELMHRRMQAIAVMNQAFAVYVNRAGHDFGGRSAVFSPLGEKLIELDEGEEVRTCDIDLAEAYRWRSEEPTFNYRHPELYGPLSELDPRSPDR